MVKIFKNDELLLHGYAFIAWERETLSKVAGNCQKKGECAFMYMAAVQIERNLDSTGDAPF